jgi:hypothetical protein
MNSKCLSLALLVATVPTYAVTTNAAEKPLTSEEADALVAKLGPDKSAALVVAELQKNLPIKMSSIEQTTGVFYLKSNKTITFRHLLAKDWERQLSEAASVPRTKVAETLRSVSHNYMVRFGCQNPLQHSLLQAGVSLEHVYYNYGVAVEFSTHVRWTDCVQAGLSSLSGSQR